MIRTPNDLLENLNCDALVEVTQSSFGLMTISITVKSEQDRILVKNQIQGKLGVGIGLYFHINKDLHLTGALLSVRDYNEY